MKRFILFSLTVFTFFGQAESVLKDVQEKYEEAKTIRIKFKQTSEFKLTDIQSETIGEFWFKKEKSYKFDTEERTLVTNGKDSWEFNKLSKQVIINEYSEGNSTPKDLLFSYQKNYTPELLSEEDDIYNIKLYPKEGIRTSDEFLLIWINSDKEIITKIIQHKLNGNTITFDILDIDFDKKMKTNDFVFNIDDEKHKVVDMRF